ncbi:MAG TPA: rhodanese-like domain-containing protein [Chryseosolibacter sp.]
MRGPYFAFLIGVLVVTSCKEKKEQSDTGVLSAEAFDDAILSTSNEIILDVRTPEEFSEGHIPNAMLINLRDEDFKTQIRKIDKQLPIYVYCASGVRSDKAATILKDEGFKQVYVLENGLNDWRASNKEIVR